MAKRSNTKRRSAKKTQKGKKKSGLASGIGVVSTIDMPAAWRTAFKSGVNNSGVQIKYAHKATYKKAKLKQEIDKLNADSKIGLIVTVGGLVAYEAADSYAKKPFVSLVGGRQTKSNPKFFGGVSLESYDSNSKRIDHLKRMGHFDEQICLFYNPNSVMQAEERKRWSGAAPVRGGINAAGDNDASTYAADFGKIPANITAVVVSADPFFQDSKDKLIAAANVSGKHVCYPLQEFANATGPNKPNKGKATLFGPSLKDSYRLLGQRAALALSTSARLDPLFASAVDENKDLV